MMVTLNGELLLNSCGSEMLAKDFSKFDGEVPDFFPFFLS